MSVFLVGTCQKGKAAVGKGGGATMRVSNGDRAFTLNGDRGGGLGRPGRRTGVQKEMQWEGSAEKGGERNGTAGPVEESI